MQPRRRLQDEIAGQAARIEDDPACVSGPAPYSSRQAVHGADKLHRDEHGGKGEQDPQQPPVLVVDAQAPLIGRHEKAFVDGIRDQEGAAPGQLRAARPAPEDEQTDGQRPFCPCTHPLSSKVGSAPCILSP